MRSRENKGRFIRKSDSEKSRAVILTPPAAQRVETKSKYKDNKGRWHGSNGKYV